jgi:N-(2-amino-2-carboxyethyl)-L-glutamate synthase
MVTLHVSHGRRRAAVLLKLESSNPTGSSKDRTAVGLVRQMHRESPLHPGSVVVESTSGNLGIAMARLLDEIGGRFVAVVDLNTPAESRAAMMRFGAEVVVVGDVDDSGGYLHNRLRLVRQLCADNPEYRWSNQYGNPANPLAHELGTGPELVEQAGRDLDAVYVAVSTGGTLAGISRYLRATRPQVRIVAVDAHGSVAVGGCAGRRLLSGIGASRRSSFLTPSAYDAVVRVTDVRSFAMCRVLAAETGLSVGGSSGSVLSACVSEVFGRPPVRRSPVCLMPDGGDNYLTSFYDDSWLRIKGVLGAVREAERAIRARGLSFAVDRAELGSRVGYLRN